MPWRNKSKPARSKSKKRKLVKRQPRKKPKIKRRSWLPSELNLKPLERENDNFNCSLRIWATLLPMMTTMSRNRLPHRRARRRRVKYLQVRSHHLRLWQLLHRIYRQAVAMRPLLFPALQRKSLEILISGNSPNGQKMQDLPSHRQLSPRARCSRRHLVHHLRLLPQTFHRPIPSTGLPNKRLRSH